MGDDMSIAAMADAKLAREQAADPTQPSPDQPVGVSTNLVNQITRWIPTETITVYVALLALVAPLQTNVSSTNFSSRWVLFWLLVAANPVVVVLMTMAKANSLANFKVPYFEMVIAPVAFAAWAFALPDTPLKAFAGYDIKWNSAIVTVTTISVTLIANALHKSPDLDQVLTKQQGAHPDSPAPAA
jgi:hypothetical protein